MKELTWVCREDGQPLNGEYVSPTKKNGKDEIFNRGCVSHKGIGKLPFIDGTMAWVIYINIIANNLQNSLYIF